MGAQAAGALCPFPAPKVCSAYFESDKVFYGKVLKKEIFDDYQQIRFMIQVLRPFKGRVQAIEVVTTGNDSGRWVADPGEQRVVFARDGKVGDLCSPIDEARHARQTIHTILALTNAKHARVEGVMRLGPGPDGPPVAGAKIQISGTHDGSFKATTDRRGQFFADVPPGQYHLVVPEGFEPSDYGRGDTDKFDLVRGQCAQFLLTPPVR